MHLTARALALALVAVVTFIAAQWSSDPDIATLWRAVLMLLAAGLALEAWAQARISISLRFMLPAALHLGRETDIEFVVTHDSRRRRRAVMKWKSASYDSLPMHRPPQTSPPAAVA
jgi:hypothetical protein